MGLVGREDLQAGMVVARDVRDRQGRVLIASGTEITERHLRALQVRGVTGVEIVADEEDETADDLAALSPEARKEAIARVSRQLRYNREHLEHPAIKQILTLCVLRAARRGALPRQPGSAAASPPPEGGLTGGEIGNPPSVQELVRRTETVASLPAVYNEIMEVVNHPRSSSADVANVISSDTGLTARLLRIVNSPFYGFPARIETVARAITVVGMNELCQMALATSVMSMFGSALRDVVDMGDFWRHSLFTGAFARLFADRRGEPSAERYFVMGLLHDIGRLVLWSQYEQGAQACLARSVQNDQPLQHAERDILGYDHADIGGALLENWNLPSAQREAVGRHHRPHLARRHEVEAVTLHWAEGFAGIFGYTALPGLPVSPLHIDTWQSLRVSGDILHGVLEEAELQMVNLTSIFGPEMTS